MNPRTPCIIGVAQRTWHPGGPAPAPEPLAMWEEVCRAAASDTGGGVDRVLGAVGGLDVLYCQSWPYDDPPGRLAARLGLGARRRTYSGIGGTTPQLLITGAAASIIAGDLEVALVVGGEALETVRQAKKAGQRLAWSHRDPEKKPFPFEAPFHPAEVSHQVFQAWLTFAVFDVARRGHLGVTPEAYREFLGATLAPLTSVAAENPHAWFREERSASELISPTPSNRMVGYPYTKTMVSIMDVDMAAALVVASDSAADSLGVPRDRRVYLRGWASANDPVYVAEHEPMWASPAMGAASAAALSAAGVGVDEVAHFDLYSCFGSSLNFACDALGLSPSDPRGLSVTGGLPFAGGPGSGYVLHATAAMVDVLRRDPGSLGMISGVGMHMTKHGFAVYGTEPPEGLDLGREGVGREAPAVPIVHPYSGPATVAAYTVVHGRGGDAEWGLAVCDVPGGRCYARFDDPGLMSEVEASEWVRAAVSVNAGEDGVNRIP